MDTAAVFINDPRLGRGDRWALTHGSHRREAVKGDKAWRVCLSMILIVLGGLDGGVEGGAGVSGAGASDENL